MTAFSKDQLQLISDEFYGSANDLARRQERQGLAREDWQPRTQHAWDALIGVANTAEDLLAELDGESL